VYPAVVEDTQDKDQMGQVLVRLPWATDEDGSPILMWARLAAPLAGNGYGDWLPPELGTEVLVAFEHGQAGGAYVIGALWNGRDRPPQSGSGQREISTASGLKISFDDSQPQAELTVETPGGRKLLLSDAKGTTTVQDQVGNRIELANSGITVDSNSNVKVNAATVEISAAMVTIDSGMVRVSGVLRADTVITNAVISSSYTPGAGNIW
jgi:uncharacterized protein involved in type VI secretion and phage assembly